MEFERTCPMTGQELVEAYFLEHRTKILDLAAFLDRLERSSDGDRGTDFRMAAFRKALTVLCRPEGPRMLDIQMIFSDPSLELRESLDQKSADGAFKGR